MTKSNSLKYSAIILAAGKGERAKTTLPKQYATLNNKPIIEYSISTFVHSNLFKDIIVVINPDNMLLYHEILIKYPSIRISYGGETRQASTLNGLKSIEDTDYVFIHDAARPFITIKKLMEIKETLTSTSGIIPALPITDTIKMVRENGLVANTINRKNLYIAQTPQAFPYKIIFNAHKEAIKNTTINFTDDSSIAEYYNIPVKIISGCPNNIKITYATDFYLAEFILKNMDSYNE